MMDTKETIKELEDLTVDYGNRNEEQIARLDEAIDMAMEALRNLPNRLRQAMDTISRKGTIEAIQQHFNPTGEELPTELASVLAGVGVVIGTMPSAQPEKRTNERTETRACDLISRQAVIDAIFSEPLYKTGMKKRDADAVVPAIYEKIKSLPSAQPTGAPLHDSGSDYAHGFADGYKQGLKDEESERVRCKDCLYWVAHDKRCVYLNHGFAPNMWCCHGRRADG